MKSVPTKSLINSIGSTLSRMKSDGEVVQVHGKWGLKEWYPGWKEPPPQEGRKRGRPKNSQAPKPKQKASAPKLTPEQIEQINALQSAGKSLSEIAKEVGLHHLKVLGILKPKTKQPIVGS